MMNPFGISGSWRVDPDNRQDRGCSKVTSYKLSQEEIEALIKNAVKPVPKIKTEVEDMSKITVEQLAEECRKLGFNAAAYEDIAKRYDYASAHNVACLVSKKGIKKLLEKEPEAKVAITKAPSPMAKPETKSDPELTAANDLEILEKIRTLVLDNRQLNAVLEENKALKDKLTKVKALLEEVQYEL